MAAELWEKYQLDRSTQLRNELVEQNLLLVLDVLVKRFSGFPTEREDLYQVGVIGLIKAVERFDFSTGNKFSSYAVVMIDGEIRHYFRDKHQVVRHPRGVKSQLTFSLNKTVWCLDGYQEMIDILENQTVEPEDWSDLLSVIRLLPESQSMPIELHFIDKLTRRQVAQKLGITPMTVTRRIDAGLEKLRGILSAS